MNVIRPHPPGIRHASAPPTHRLTVFGGLTLSESAGPLGPAAERRRPLALLALLAGGGERGVSRERLLVYLWPESDTRRARNALNQTLYAMRRDLGAEQIATGGATLVLDRTLLGCDLWDFEEALAAGDLAAAVAAYGGPFLDGFALPGLIEFERWAEDERARHAAAYRAALGRLAAAAEGDGDRAGALRWWRRFAAAAPLSAAAACGVMRALAATGDRGAALEHARLHAAVVRSELGADPDPSVAALAERIRVAPAATPAAPPVELPVEMPVASEAAAAEPHDVAAREVAVREVVEQSRGRADARPWRRVGVAAAGVALGLAASVGAWWVVRPTASLAGDTRGAPRVAVLPFDVTGSDSLAAYGLGVVDLLSASLGGGDFEPVDPRAVRSELGGGSRRPAAPGDAAAAARRLRADAFVLGEVVVVGGRLRLAARWYDRGRRVPVARAVAEGEPRELFAVVDRLAERLLADRVRGSAGRLARAAAEGTRSLAAFKSYLAAGRHMAEGEYAAAIDAYARAVAADSAFALADYGLSVAAEWAGRDSLARAAIARAEAHAGALQEHERRLVVALAEFRAGRHDAAEQLYLQIVDDYPDDAEAWFQLGELRFHTNPLRGRSATEARAAFERVVQLEPGDEEVLMHLARIAYIEGRKAAVDSIVRRLLAGKNAAAVLELRAFRSFALGDRDRQKRVTNELRRNPPDVSPVTALDVAVYRDDLEGAEAFAAALRGSESSADVRALGFRLLARTAAARGRWGAAAAALDSAVRHDSVSAYELRAILASLPFLAVPRDAVAATRALTAAWRPGPDSAPGESHSAAHTGLHAHIRLHRLGLLSAALGDSLGAARAADSLAALAVPPNVFPTAGQVLARSVRASAAYHAGRAAEALAILEGTPWPTVAPLFEAEARDRFLRAEALHALGRCEEALGWYRSIAERAAYELVYLAPAELRQAEIRDRRGERALAARHHARFAELWASADAPLQPRVAEARRRLAELRAHAPRRQQAR